LCHERKRETAYFQIAAVVLADAFMDGGIPVLRFWRSQWWRWDGRSYRLVPPHTLKLIVRGAIVETAGGGYGGLRMVGSVITELKFQPQVSLPDHWEPPFVIPDDEFYFSERSDSLSAANLPPLANGVLDMDVWLRGPSLSSSRSLIVVRKAQRATGAGCEES